MSDNFKHLGIFSDWVEAAKKQRELYPVAAPGPQTRQKLRDVMGFCSGPEIPLSVRTEQRWERDGVSGEEVSWWVGYGPRTRAYVLKPAAASGPLPGILALHDHDGYKFYGIEKLADGPEEPLPTILARRKHHYGGRAYANALAKEGYVVLVHDTFLWGSRRFPLEDMPVEIQEMVKAESSLWQSRASIHQQEAEYNQACMHHEHLVEKYCNLLGTTLAGVVCYEDRVALNYLLSRPDVRPGSVGCLGLSGGGNRSVLLLATHERIQAAVIVGLMSTYPGLLDHNVYTHTWMFFPNGWARVGDWPDIAASRAPLPLLVQYDLEDEIFTAAGMRAAHERIAAHYRNSGFPEAYTGQFYPGPHKFDLEMQQAAFTWLANQLKE